MEGRTNEQKAEHKANRAYLVPSVQYKNNRMKERVIVFL